MRYFLLILCIVELLMVTWLQNFAGPYISPILLLGSSLGIGFLYLKIANTRQVLPISAMKLPRIAVTILQLIPFIILSYLVFKTNKTIWWWHATIDNGLDKSDIIPQITVLVKRFLSGEQPYYPIPLGDYTLYPTYLPLQWMPYIATEMLHKDYRWIPVVALWLASLYFFIKYRSVEANIVLKIVLPVFPLIAWYSIVMYDNDMFKLTVEGLVAGYYLFVACNIGGRRVLPLAIGIALCLLSRYSIVLWVPLALACFYIAGEKRKALIIAGVTLLLFLVFYWIFIHGYQYHTTAAYGEWLNDLQVLKGKFYLYNGFGFTAWALKLVPGDLNHVLTVYQKIHLVLCISTVGGLFYYFKQKKDSINLNAFLLFSFKVYLAVFYAFIQIPYKYLFLVPVVVSGVLLAEVFKREAGM
jgi:hypothetical protein